MAALAVFHGTVAAGSIRTDRAGAALSPATAELAGDSPFAISLGDRAATLAPALRAQYLLPPESPYRILLTGTATRVWHRPAWLWPFFWALGSAGILFTDTGSSVPASMHIDVQRDADGAVYYVWRRIFGFPKPRPFDALLRFDRAANRVVEHLGPRGALRVVWSVHALAPRLIVIVTEGMSLAVGPLRFPLPRLLCPEVRAIEQVDLHHANTIHLDLRVRHSLLGPIFGYSGTFHLRRLSLPDSRDAAPTRSATNVSFRSPR